MNQKKVENKNHLWSHVFFEESFTEFTIPIICDMTTVHDLSKEIPQIFPWYLRCIKNEELMIIYCNNISWVNFKDLYKNIRYWNIQNI